MFQNSLTLLKQGKFLLVVPEDPKAEHDPLTGIQTFKRGFLRLGELYYRETGARLPFYPVAIHEAGLVIIGKPIAYNPLNESKLERLRMVSLLEQTIKSIHIEATENQIVEPIFFKRKIS